MDEVAARVQTLIESTKRLTAQSGDLSNGIAQATHAFHELGDDVRHGLESLEQVLSDKAHHLESALADLRHDLPAAAEHAEHSADDIYQTVRSESETAIHDLEMKVREEIDQIVEHVTGVLEKIRRIKQGIEEALNTMSSVRKTTLALTSPLRSTSAAAGDALKIAMETFHGIG